mgnify:CR=1 FL=1
MVLPRCSFLYIHSYYIYASLIVFPQKVSEVTFEIEMGGKSFIKKIGEMDLVPGHIHPYTVIISERDETIYVTVESGEVQG